MSYDLKFFRTPDSIDPAQLCHQIEEREESGEEDGIPHSSADKLQMRKIATALKHWRPTLQEFVSNEPLAWIELDDREHEIHLVIRGDHANASIPYFCDRPREMMESLIGCAEVLREIVHYSAYDRQLGRVVTCADLNDMVAAYTRVERTGVLDVAHAPPRQRPWWRFW